MDFKENEAIYLQIAKYISEEILAGKWDAENKILSVRDLAIQLQVNPNTVMRSYDYLQNREIIYNKRGIGFFVSPGAVTKIKDDKKRSFVKEELPVLFKTMKLLNIDLDEVSQLYEQFKSGSYNHQSNKNENQ